MTAPNDSKMQQLTESVLFKLIVPVGLPVLGFLVLHAFNGVEEQQRTSNQRLERIESQLADARADKATYEYRLKSVEGLAPAVRQAQDDVLLLNQRVRDLESTRGK